MSERLERASFLASLEPRDRARFIALASLRAVEEATRGLDADSLAAAWMPVHGEPAFNALFREIARRHQDGDAKALEDLVDLLLATERARGKPFH